MVSGLGQGGGADLAEAAGQRRGKLQADDAGSLAGAHDQTDQAGRGDQAFAEVEVDERKVGAKAEAQQGADAGQDGYSAQGAGWQGPEAGAARHTVGGGDRLLRGDGTGQGQQTDQPRRKSRVPAVAARR